ncbi:MAG: metallophosphoesterase family protein [Gemmatimonas sp.]
MIHSSDIHVDTDWTARQHGGDGTRGLRAVLDTARAVVADVVLLAGDVFDHNRLPDAVLERVAALLDAAGRPVIVLPGNHDAAAADCAWRRSPFAACTRLHVLGVTHRTTLRFPHLHLEVTGKPHRDYDDMVPLERSRARRARWRIAVAHGHYVPVRDRSAPHHPSWLIHDRHLAAVDADYIALGHWNRPARVGPRAANAHYCGSPELAGTVNLVTLRAAGGVRVRREPIRWSDGELGDEDGGPGASP